MYLHLGKGYMVPRHDVIFIGQMECLNSEETKSFMDLREKEKDVIDISEGEPQSFIVTPDRVFLSLISAGTLEKRLKKSVTQSIKEG